MRKNKEGSRRKNIPASTPNVNWKQAMGIPGNLEARDGHLGSHRNTWAAIGILGNLEAGDGFWNSFPSR